MVLTHQLFWGMVCGGGRWEEEVGILPHSLSKVNSESDINIENRIIKEPREDTDGCFSNS